MGVRLFIFCVLIYETILISSPEAVTLPFTNLVATVTPRKPKPLSPESAAPVPRIPKSGDAVLNYFKSQFPEKDFSSLCTDFSAPLTVISASKTLPASSVESLINRNNPVVFNSPNVLTSDIATSTLLPKSDNSVSESNILTEKLSLTPSYIIPISVSVQPEYTSDYSTIPIKSPSLNFPVNLDNRSGISSFTVDTGSLPIVSTLPKVSVQPRYKSGFSKNVSTIPVKSSSIKTPINPDYGSVNSPHKTNTGSIEPSVITLPNVYVQPQYTNEFSTNLLTSQFQNLPFYPDDNSGITTINVNTGSTLPNLSTLPNFPLIPDYTSGFPSLPKVSIQPKYTTEYLNNLLSLSTVNSQIPDYGSIILPFIPNMAPIINSLPSVSLDYQKLNSLTPDVYSSSLYYTRFPYDITPEYNPFYSVPYPLQYSMLSLPKVTPPRSVTSNRNITPIGCTEDINIYPSVIETETAATFSPLYFENPFSPKVTSKTYSNSLTDNSNLLNKELSRNLPLSVSQEYPQVRNSRTINNADSFNKMPDFSLKPMPSYDNPLSNFDPQPDVKDFTVPDLNFPEKMPFNVPDDYFSTAPFIKSIPEVPDIFSSSTKASQRASQKDTPTFKPSSTSKSSSTITNLISDITKKLLKSANLRSKATPLKKSVGKMKSFPKTAHQQNQESSRLLALISACKKLLKSKTKQHGLSSLRDIPQTTYDNPMIIESKTIKPRLTADLYLSVQKPLEDHSANTVIPSQTREFSFTEPENKSILPVTSLPVDLDSQPSLPDVSSPVVPLEIEDSSEKESKLIQNAKTVEKLLELVFLAELLNGDDFVDWEALDDVLAFLCVD